MIKNTKLTFKKTVLATGAVLALSSVASYAETLKWARAGDSLTLDPHAQNEGPTHTLAHQIYEGLLQRDMAGKIIPALATDWDPLPTPMFGALICAPMSPSITATHLMPMTLFILSIVHKCQRVR